MKKHLNADQIIKQLKQNQSSLKNYTVRKIGLFGSYSKCRQTRTSDIDFLVDFKEPTYDNFIGTTNYLEKLFGRKIDILTPAGVKSIRIKEVAKDINVSLLSSSNNAFSEFRYSVTRQCKNLKNKK